jgi:hypothetical protein
MFQLRFLRILILFSTCALGACALFEERTGPTAYYGPREQVYYATFEEVWRATNLVLQPYPLRVSNMDQGTLETDVIRGYKVWGPPFKTDVGRSGESYHLTLHVVKGALDKRQATKVTLLKDGEVQADFFSEPRALPSDGMEEVSILYRIGREIQLERALSKAQKRHNQTPTMQ